MVRHSKNATCSHIKIVGGGRVATVLAARIDGGQRSRRFSGGNEQDWTNFSCHPVAF